MTQVRLFPQDDSLSYRTSGSGDSVRCNQLSDVTSGSGDSVRCNQLSDVLSGHFPLYLLCFCRRHAIDWLTSRGESGIVSPAAWSLRGAARHQQQSNGNGTTVNAMDRPYYNVLNRYYNKILIFV
jgi:hypothetical protein